MGNYGGDKEIITTKQIVCCFCCHFENATVNNNKCFILYVSICQFRRYFSSSLRGLWWHEADFSLIFISPRSWRRFCGGQYWSVIFRGQEQWAEHCLILAWTKGKGKTKEKSNFNHFVFILTTPPFSVKRCWELTDFAKSTIGQCRMPSKEISPRIKSPDK